MLIVRSPVRISFGGGGTDLPAYYESYGGAVLSTAINKYFYTVLGQRKDGRVQVISSDLRVFETWSNIAKMNINGSGLEIPLAILKELRHELSVDLFLASEIPPGTGLGSSASVCVNILKTLTTYLNRPLSKHALAEQAFHITRNVLHRHVGKQDEYAAAFGGLNFVKFNSNGTVEVEPVDITEESKAVFQKHLMLFFTGSAHHSWTILDEQEKLTRKQSGVAVDALHHIRHLADEMHRAICQNDFDVVGSLMHQSWESKKRVLGKISTQRIDHLYELALENGALGGKITGAGGGGFLLLYCPVSSQTDVRTALEAEGVQEMAFEFDNQGAQVVVNDPFLDGDERTALEWVFTPIENFA